MKLRFKIKQGLLRVGARMFTPASFRWYELNQLRDDAAPPVQPVADVASLITRINAGASYEPDKLHGKLDVLTHPRIVQRHIDSGKPLGDCEDHAGYVLSCLLKSGLAAHGWMGTVQMRSVDDGALFGHAVSIWQDPIEATDGHSVVLSAGGDFWTMDYADPRPVRPRTWDWVRVYEQRFNAVAIEASVARATLRHDDGLAFSRFQSKGFRR